MKEEHCFFMTNRSAIGCGFVRVRVTLAILYLMRDFMLVFS